jgi:hypothetical protein
MPKTLKTKKTKIEKCCGYPVDKEGRCQREKFEEIKNAKNT